MFSLTLRVVDVVAMTCEDSPCENNGTCKNISKSCSPPDKCLGFICQCEAPFTGVVCQYYKTCYLDTKRCYSTDYHVNSFDKSAQHCKRRGNLSTPVILNAQMDENFRRFLTADPHGQLQKACVWLGAQSQPVNPSDNTEWTWLNGVSTSNYQHY